MGTVAATDADGDDLTFTITNGNTNSAFAINADGDITVAGTLDYETTQVYALTVQVSDGTNTTEAAVTINVRNVNDNAPTIAAQTFSVAENTAARTVGTVMATGVNGGADVFHHFGQYYRQRWRCVCYWYPLGGNYGSNDIRS